jgi:Icc-related predicted phosphoesterase
MPDRGLKESNERRRRVVATLVVGFVAGVVSLVALRFVPPSQHALGPTTVSTAASLGFGHTTLFVPPLGTVVANTHLSPLNLRLTITSIDPDSLGDAVTEPTNRDLFIKELEEDLRATAVRVALQLMVGGLALGAIVAALLPRRRLRSIIAGSIGGFVVVGSVIWLTAQTYDVRAFEQPQFTGALERAPQVIDALAGSVESIEGLRSRYTTAAERLSDLLSIAAVPTSDPQQDSTAILHISDIHSNPLGVQFAGELARRFDVDAILDTGDLTSFGEPIEARIAGLIANFDVPYLFVPGNHDSNANRRVLSNADNIKLLDGNSVDIGGVDILGYADPTFTATNETSTEEGNEIRSHEALEVAELVSEEEPNVLAVHDSRLAVDSVASVPLVLCGHTHERAFDQEDGTVTLTVGSTGATGLGSFIVESDLPYEAEIIYFKEGVAVAFDYVSVTGLGTDFEVQRRTLIEPGPG